MNAQTPELNDVEQHLTQPQTEMLSSEPAASFPFPLSASPWLSAYVAFSRTWSPRAYDGFHVACALWLLSTVAACRVVLHLGKLYYTPLYIALVARSSLYSKSTTTAIALDILKAAGLDWLLAPDNSTPRRFIRDLSLNLPENYSVLSSQQRERVLKRLAFTAQRGWFYDEFGQQLASLIREQGSLADFRSLLRRLDDCKDSYEYASLGRGSDVLQRPYLALLANLTPADMQRSSRRGSSLWNDGFWARFAFSVPPVAGYAAEHARFPVGLRIIPPALSDPLRAWHDRLGTPKLTITCASSFSPSGEYSPQIADGHLSMRVEEVRSEGQIPVLAVEPLDPVVCILGEGVMEAFYAYHDDLLEMAQGNNLPDLDASYARLAEKALRVAMLVASLENDNHIELSHWSLGHTIAEVWRADLHALYEQLRSAPSNTLEPQPRPEPTLEERLITIVRRHPDLTANRIAHFVRGLSVLEAQDKLAELVYSGCLECYVDEHCLRYKMHDSTDNLNVT